MWFCEVQRRWQRMTAVFDRWARFGIMVKRVANKEIFAEALVFTYKCYLTKLVSTLHKYLQVNFS